MEQPPSALYQKLTGAPPRVVTDSNKNGYFMLLGFDAPVGQDPIEAGKARTVDEHHTAVAQACIIPLFLFMLGLV